MAKIAKKRRTQGGTPAFASAISALKKEIVPSIGLTNASVFLLSDLAEVLTKRLIETSGRLAAYDGKSTLKTRHAATAAQLVFIGGMSKPASAFADEAVAKFTEATAKA